MFSRYKKSAAVAPPGAARPAAAAPVPQVPIAATPETPKPGVQRRVMPGAPVTAQAAAADKDRKRKERMGELKVELHKRLLENLNLAALEHASEAELKAEIAAISGEAMTEMSVVLNAVERQSLHQELYDEVMGLGPLEPLLKDETVSDILVNGPNQIFVERFGKLQLSDVTFKDEKHLLRIIDKIVSAVGRRVDESNPYVDARLADGSRFNAMVPPVAVDGSLVSIRKFKKDKLAIDDLVRFGAFTEEMAAYLQAAVATRLNVIVSGGTGSGKTTTLNALSSFIDNSERILTIEDTAELQLQQTHVGRMESRPPNVEGKGAVTQRDCLRNALRMRPDRIIVGETRGEEVIDMLQAMNTGHDGSMTTIHANNARDGISRLENMVAMAGIEMPLKAVRSQIASAVNLIVQASRLQDGSRRMVSITEITGMEGDVISMQEIFRYERLGLAPDGKIIGRFTATGVRSHYSDRFRQWGYDLPASIYEPVQD
ncbi:CpaF family protein [Rhodobacter capsulatus]|uniref:CpaF family protein n=2 Tax=Rhodobacter capsulatus TaxID=1061 RepID=UPI0003D35D3B|nr:CpaF family protein [Rhodobacter capsulatus]ETD03004.1 CpaF pilus assembly protein, ATPase CpaF [Rhodobacter capsulatus DE442]ETD79633.1 CpaF pilus assembly protein, ATPase CpaF [Rhodobacter capsulatus R121]ETE55063.1 CpaF pilus assembly protein, ATPase CpaF [Rhodobacter capsulatus Y262]MDS0925954.1 CpaF family protein [Rhodobacter capsulatus]TQD36019.1 CpaF family protein [Rhodobacter capsulatus]